jgi:hypothetical protein
MQVEKSFYSYNLIAIQFATKEQLKDLTHMLCV